jgi:antitoxin VapB
MPLYIRDDDVDALAVRVQEITGARTKTEAVREALRHEIERTLARLPLRERLAAVIAKARLLGPGDPDFDMKAYSDEMWGE